MCGDIGKNALTQGRDALHQVHRRESTGLRRAFLLPAEAEDADDSGSPLRATAPRGAATSTAGRSQA